MNMAQQLNMAPHTTVTQKKSLIRATSALCRVKNLTNMRAQRKTRRRPSSKLLQYQRTFL